MRRKKSTIRTATVGFAAILIAACGSDELIDQAATPTSDQVATTTSAIATIDLDADPAQAAQLVIDAINDEADALVEVNAMFIVRDVEGVSTVENFATTCREEQPILDATAEALPEQIGDIRVDGVYASMRDAYLEWRSVQADACETLATQRAEMEADESLFTELSTSVRSTKEAMQLACTEAIEAFAEFYGRLNCTRDSDVEPSVDVDALIDSLSDADGSEASEDDVSEATSGPTGGGLEPAVELAAGPARFDWFPRPFSIDHPETLNVQSTDDYIWVSEWPRGPTVEIYAFEELADPERLGVRELLDTIPLPDDLDDWFADLPVIIEERTDLEVADDAATYWQFTRDDEAIVAASGDLGAVLAMSSIDPFAGVVLFPEGPQQHYLWHIRAASGPVIVHAIDASGGDREFAESILASISFD